MEGSGSLTAAGQLLSLFTDGNDESCYSTAVGTIRLEMEDEVEVSAITIRFEGECVDVWDRFQVSLSSSVFSVYFYRAVSSACSHFCLFVCMLV